MRIVGGVNGHAHLPRLKPSAVCMNESQNRMARAGPLPGQFQSAGAASVAVTKLEGEHAELLVTGFEGAACSHVVR